VYVSRILLLAVLIHPMTMSEGRNKRKLFEFIPKPSSKLASS